jgi:hypothetical protein
MSRTDAHTPRRVRVARREIAVRAVHRCAGGECDLPALDPGWTIGRIGRCYWEFVYTGTNVCSCWMCHWRHRPESPRTAVRTQLRAKAREWNSRGREL